MSTRWSSSDINKTGMVGKAPRTDGAPHPAREDTAHRQRPTVVPRPRSGSISRATAPIITSAVVGAFWAVTGPLTKPFLYPRDLVTTEPRGGAHVTNAANDPQVADVQAESRFVFRDDHAVAELVYRLDGDRLILVHTGVPEALGGRGVGGRLVRASITRAAREGLTVVPWCPFARGWLKEHPEAAQGVTIDFKTPPPAA